MRYTILKNTCLLFALSSALIFGLSACEKEEVNIIPNIPEIALVSISSDTITEFEEPLIIRISYKDGDGNIGFEETDRYALFVRDIRLDEFDGFYLGPILPPTSVAPITGELNVEFPDLFIFGNADSETTRFEIKLVDRAQNESNLLITEDIVIVKP